MTCAEAREAILDADPAELMGTGDGELSRHLGRCSRCRNLAAAVLEGETILAAELVNAVPVPDLDHILAEGSLEASDAWGRGSLGARVLRPARRFLPVRMHRSVSRRVLLPLALAAGAASLLLFRGPSPLPGPAFTPLAAAPGLEVEAPPDRSVVLLATEDPNLVVVWLFPPSEEP